MAEVRLVSKCCGAEAIYREADRSYNKATFPGWWCLQCRKSCSIEGERISVCCGEKATMKTVKVPMFPIGSKDREWQTWVCSKCHKPCEVKEVEDGDEC